MATNYPSSIDSYSTKNTGDTIQAADVNNPQSAIVALETKVGVDSSAVTSTIDYLLKNTASVSPGHKHVIADITNAGSFIVTGLILPYAGASAPTGFLLCDGSAVSRSTYASLFSLFSTTYGVGDGVTTFNVPDLRSRSIIGVGTGKKVLTFASRSSNTITVTGMANSTTNEVQFNQSVTYSTTGAVITGLSNNTVYYIIPIAYNQFQLASAPNGSAISLSSNGSGTQTFTINLTARTLADTGGEELHNLNVSEIPSHSHPSGTDTGVNNGNGTILHLRGVDSSGVQTGTSGSDTAHDNMSPFLALTYIIKT